MGPSHRPSLLRLRLTGEQLEIVETFRQICHRASCFANLFFLFAVAGAPGFQFDIPYTLAAASCCNSTHRFLCRRFGVSRNLSLTSSRLNEQLLSRAFLLSLI